MTATAVAANAPLPPPARSAPLISPANVTIDHMGHCWKSVQVRLPAGFIADDLKEPLIWCHVQHNTSKALRQHDQLYMIAADRAWVAEARVSEADANGATLVGIRILQTPQRSRVLFRDTNYAVEWDGVGYFVARLSDNHKMTQTVATEQLAERDLRNLYPQRVGR
jgi:hypothetical protein